MRIRHASASISLAGALALAVGLTSFPDSATAAWKPNKPVKFVIMAGRGKDADRLARLMWDIVRKSSLSSKAFVPVNKAGESGAEALRYLRDQRRDRHVVMVTTNEYFTAPLRNPDLGIDISKFTPIARLAVDTFQLWVHADSGIKDVNDYVAAAKKAGAANWKMGGTKRGSDDFLVTTMFRRAFGIRGTYVPFDRGDLVARGLIDKRIDSTVNNPSEQAGFWQASASRPLATFSPRRLKEFPNVPTFRELGHDIVYFAQYSVVAPADIDDEVRDYYIDIFSKIHESKIWLTHLSQTGMRPGWLTGKKLTDYLTSEYNVHRKLLQDLGDIP